MASSNVEARLREGLAHHQANRLDEAERAYREVLAFDAGNAWSYYLLGALLNQRGQSEAGAEMITRSVHLGLRSPEQFNHLGECYRSLGRLEEAIQSYQTALQLNPQHAEAMSNFGAALNRLGRFTQSLPLLERALSLRPDLAEAHFQYGLALEHFGRLDDALRQWEMTLRLWPDHLNAMSRLGMGLQQKGQLKNALAVLSELVRRHPGFAEGWANYAIALGLADEHDQAIAMARKAVELAPDQAESYNALGTVFMDAEKFDDASAMFRRAIELDPNYTQAMANYGRTFLRTGDYSEAERWLTKASELDPLDLQVFNAVHLMYSMQQLPEKTLEAVDRMLTLRPNHPDLQFYRALVLLVLGRYLEGFEEYEGRWNTSDCQMPLPKFDRPIWDGSNPAGKTIYVLPEQGFGDMIHFARYLHLVVGQGARVIVALPHALVQLFRSIPGISVVTEETKVTDFDAYISLLSLPRVFKTTFETIPAHVPYLFPDPIRVQEWQPIIDGHAKGLKVGLIWGGNMKTDPKRSCTFKDISVLSDVPGISWYSLQTGEHRDQLQGALEMNALDTGANIRDFADTAAVMSQMDLIITIDTASAHLAGALGLKTWTMLPHAPDWRWLNQGESTPWYPTMKLFRQNVLDAWSPVIEQIRNELLALVTSMPDRSL